MHERDVKVFLKDIVTGIQKIQKYIGRKTYEEFVGNDLLIDGVIRNLEVIGEAVKNIPLNFRKRYPLIEWKKVAGLRDILIHEYSGIDYEILWDIIKTKIPQLHKDVEIIFKDLNKLKKN
jgi:Uncharacterized conserved protein